MAKEVNIIKNEQKGNMATLYNERQQHINRQSEMGFVNPDTGAFFVAKKDGEIASGVDTTNQTKKTKNNHLEVAPEIKEVCNRRALVTDDFLINNQKMNMQLLNISDTAKLFEHSNIGGFTVNGSVLVKVWEKNLGRYVLMRRPIRTPLFSRVLGAPEIPEILDFDIAHVKTLDKNLAHFIQNKRQQESQITDDMTIAEGGSTYNQGAYNNYLNTYYNNTTRPYASPSISQSINQPIIITERLLPVPSKKRTGKTIDLKGVTIHSTANLDSSADSERRYLENPENTNDIAWHLVIDDKECIMAIPLNEFAVHAQAGSHTTFGIEICESGNRSLTIERAARLVAQLMKQYSFTFDNVYKHHDWENGDCPSIFMYNNWQGWDDFLEMVRQILEESDLINTNPNKNTYCWPCPDAKIITAKLGDGRNHDGWDISAPDAYSKNITICASRDGIVEVVNQTDGQFDRQRGYGACVYIHHGEGIKTLYAHLKNNSVTVKEGATVKQGEKIGIMGNTGSVMSSRGGTGTHLHFSIYKFDSSGKKSVIDPEGLLDSNS